MVPPSPYLNNNFHGTSNERRCFHSTSHEKRRFHNTSHENCENKNPSAKRAQIGYSENELFTASSKKTSEPTEAEGA